MLLLGWVMIAELLIVYGVYSVYGTRLGHATHTDLYCDSITCPKRWVFCNRSTHARSTFISLVQQPRSNRFAEIDRHGTSRKNRRGK
ncbi:hypothetical protein F4810DRAFT_674056 [Camillea tinctor]|nr:hypothetical protein F4810DRAFT_674056 [Camillea tinctor]